jgi:hypothetical protein
VYRDNSCHREKINRAAGQQAAGIPAAVRVLALPLSNFNHDEKHYHHLPGPSHLENYTLTRNLLPIYPDLAKTQPAQCGRQLTLPPGRYI